MAYFLRFAARSDVGMVRAKNDDSAYVGRYLAVVADGMGGHAGGNIASASTVLDLVHLDRSHQRGDAGTELADEIQTANSLLSELVSTNPQLAGMGTTVTALLLNGDRLELAHIGDSRAYRLKNGVFEQITTDHTFVQRLIDEGRLRPEEADVHPHKNVLMRVLGDVDASPELDLQTLEVEPGERWLLCSDGLTAVLNDRMVEQIVRETPNLDECVNALVELTLAGGSPDNVTVAVIEVALTTGDEPEPELRPVLPSAREAAGEREASSGPADVSAAASEGPAEPAVRADLIRADLLSRPHLLVGAAALATETGQIPIVTQRSTERRAALMLTHKAQAPDGPLEEAPAPPVRRWLGPAFVTLGVLILLAVLGFGYTWTQTRFYVAAAGDRVAVYNGVPQTLGPIQLSHVYERTTIPVSNLPEFRRSQLEGGLPASDLQEAERIIEDLRGELRAVGCAPEGGPQATDGPSAEPTPGPSASASPKPTASPSASRSASPSASPSASAGATSTPRAQPSPSDAQTDPGAVTADCGGNLE
ncbi:PP2C family protein-serine/threonine phosphatase [Arthrobacter zhaoguopingii]|uniref:PP2C family protein-serine/threonine phosphatase n=1 Tax=Arthrobacter zhaoguopingii TaxID=2681491 RepID=UPI001FE76948|nr:PP2C family serine/threonine-protein phosphatase [Arthrobacter zhaoguopingii]